MWHAIYKIRDSVNIYCKFYIIKWFWISNPFKKLVWTLNCITVINLKYAKALVKALFNKYVYTYVLLVNTL